MKRHEALKVILENLRDELVVTTTGMISREAFSTKDRPENFYMVGSMGLVTPLCLGIALGCKNKVIGIEGDGSMFLNLGSMSMVGAEKPDNLITIVIDNGCYESTGGQYCISQKLDLSKLAESSGYLSVAQVDNEEDLKEKVLAFLKKTGPSFILVKVDSSRQEGIPRVSFTPEEIKERFIQAISYD